MIDMTPMVDLGFLLITFFIFTTSMAQPRVAKLIMPNQDGPPTSLGETNAFTAILAGDDKVFVYSGMFSEAIKRNKIVRTTFDVQKGLGFYLRKKQTELGIDESKLVFLIKPLNASTYQNVVDALDEAAINGVDRFAIVKASKEEIEHAGE